MFEELYAPLPDRDAYLTRIGLPGLRPDGSLETLNEILRAHVRAIPFENLDAWAGGRPPALGVRDLFGKIVLGRRGGWCHELNGLLHALLQSLGYRVRFAGGRVTTKVPLTPIGHRAVVCALDGREYYCDVGFGDIVFGSAIALDGTPSPCGFRIEKNGAWYEIWEERGKRRKVVSFADLAFEPVDFLYANYASALDPEEFFRNTLYVSVLRDDGRLLLQGGTLWRTDGDGGRTVLEEFDPGDRQRLRALLEEYFNIEYDFAGASR